MKTKNIAEMIEENRTLVEDDEVMQGGYWEGDFATKRYGVPFPLVRIAEGIAEGLLRKDAVEFFASIAPAIGEDGRDLSLLHWKFIEDVLNHLPVQSDETRAVIEGMRTLATGGVWSAADAAYAYADARAAATANAACSAAYAAARIAADAACTAFYEDIVHAADAVACVADGAVDARTVAADAYDERKRQAAVFLDLLSAENITDMEHDVDREASAARLASGWMPIESAPKDGTVVFVWHVARVNPYAGFDTNIKKARYLPEVEEWQVESVGGNMPPVVSHWMPLPEAPEEIA